MWPNDSPNTDELPVAPSAQRGLFTLPSGDHCPYPGNSLSAGGLTPHMITLYSKVKDSAIYTVVEQSHFVSWWRPKVPHFYPEHKIMKTVWEVLKFCFPVFQNGCASFTWTKHFKMQLSSVPCCPELGINVGLSSAHRMKGLSAHPASTRSL